MGQESVSQGSELPDGRLGTPSRERLQELIALAQAYRGWSIKELAQFVGRDPHNIVPSSGIPKLDLVVRLAEALEWPVGNLVEDLCGTSTAIRETGSGVEPTFHALNVEAYRAHVEGRYQHELAVAARALDVAASGEERATAYMRQLCGWEGLGRYTSALEAARRALAETDVSMKLRMRLKANLAGCYFALGQVTEGEGISTTVLQFLDSTPPPDHTWNTIRAMALYVRAQCRRVRAELERDQEKELANQSRADFASAEREWLVNAERMNVDAFRGIAHTCRGGALLAEVIAGTTTAKSAVSDVLKELERATDLDTVPAGDWLESYGWWSIFGCHIAIRGVADAAELDRLMAIFTNKAYEIAERLQNWTLRERVFTFDHLWRTQHSEGRALQSGVLLDREDVQILAGTMGRFPGFRAVGWEMLRQTRPEGLEGS